ncbi:MAG: hydrogenase small subunit [Desulforhopalus sp.]
MRIDRRQFLKYCMGSAAALGLPMTVLGKLEQALAEGTAPKVIWLNAANCTGCTVSLSNLFSDSGPTDIADLLINTIDLAFHPTLMAAAGDLAVQQINNTTAQGGFILVVEGGIPTAFGGNTCMLWTENGHEVTAMEAVTMLAPQASAILSIGTCASYGGIPAATPNPTGIVSVAHHTGLNTINLPGCPTHPDWIVHTIANLIAGQAPSRDYYGRPTPLYGSTVHSKCPRREAEEANTFGVPHACLEELGCKGEDTRGDCPSRKWNSGTNWCIGAGAICIGCTEERFPDGFSPFYTVQYGYQQYDKQVPEEPPTDQPEDPTPETPTDPPASSLRITKAEWQDKRSTLTVRGAGDPGQIVAIYNHENMGVQYGAVSVSGKGTWKFRIRKPSPVPQSVRAICNGVSAHITVANAPATATA